MYLLYAVVVLFLAAIIYGAVVRRKIYSEVDRLEEWKIDIMNRPITEELSKIKGLQLSGEAEEKFESWRSDWDDIIGVRLPDMEERLFDIEEVANKYRFRKAKEWLGAIEMELYEVEEQLKRIIADINHLIHSEEYNRSAIVEAQKLYQELKKYFTVHRLTLLKTAPKFEERLESIKEQFVTFEEATNHGNYFKASEILLSIKEQVYAEQVAMEEVPKWIVQIQTTIPNELENLTQGIHEMEASGFVLDQFLLHKTIKTINKQMKELLLAVEDLQLEGVEDELLSVNATIEEMYDTLEAEVKARQSVEGELGKLYTRFEQLKLSLGELKQETENVQLSYLVAEEELKMHEEIEEQLKELLKHLHVINDVTENRKQAFTSILEMVEQFSQDIHKVEEDIVASKETLHTLRRDERKANETIKDLKRDMLVGKRLVQKSNLPGVPKALIDEMDRADAKLNVANQKLEEVPLEMDIVNEKVEEALYHVNKSTTYIETTIENAELAERLIQYGNRYRSSSETIDEGLLKAEDCFRNFEYDEAIEVAVRVIERVEPDVLEKVDRELEKV